MVCTTSVVEDIIHLFVIHRPQIGAEQVQPGAHQQYGTTREREEKLMSILQRGGLVRELQVEHYN